MTPDIGFIMDTAQRNPGHFPVQTPGNGIGNGGFSHTGRANQTDNLGRHLGRQLAYRKDLQNTLLYLFQAEMVVFQNLSGSSHIHPFFGGNVPGQFQHGIQVVPQNRTFGRTKGLLFQTVHILQKLLFLFLRQLQIADILNIGFKFIFVAAFSQLFPDHLNLFPQIVIPVILVDGCTGFFLDFRFQPEHFHLLPQQTQCRLQPAHRIQLTKQLRLIREIDSGILRNGISHKAGAFTGYHLQIHCLGRMLRHLQILAIERSSFTPHRMGP